MRWDVLTALRDRQMANQALADYLASTGHKEATHIVGFPRPKNSRDYPYISYVPSVERGSDSPQRAATVSVSVGINQPALVDGIYLGIEQVATAVELIITDLMKSPGIAPGVWVTEEWQSFSDLGRDHPIYWIETAFNLRVRN